MIGFRFGFGGVDRRSRRGVCGGRQTGRDALGLPVGNGNGNRTVRKLKP